MKTMADHAPTCAHYGDSMMPCTCGADPDIVGCHYDKDGKLRPNEQYIGGFTPEKMVGVGGVGQVQFYPVPRIIKRVMDDGISTKDGCA